MTKLNFARFIALFMLIFSLSGCELVDWKAKQDESDLHDAGYQAHYLPLEEGGSMKYWVGGTGEPLLLIHGFGGSAISTWKNEMLALSKQYRVIAPDLPWFGGSYSQGTPNLTTQTDAVWQMLDALKIDKVNVAGISYGGFVTYNMMLEPNRVKKGVIIASPGPLFSDQDLEALCLRAGVDKPEDLFVPENQQEVRRLFDHVFFEPKKMPDFIAEQIYSNYFSPYKNEKRLLIQSLPQDRDRISSYSPSKLPPSLLIWGDSDQIFPLSNGISLSEYLNSAIIVIPDTGHGVTNEQPEIVTKLLKSYIG
ncbi:alpha/beta hydrolase [Photobacterium sanctipauli]|uniref:Alpha/beta hydrolase n=1 Tax=Photobacterium sanctipauli TaxID=1342794 RepID=A0A2T3NVN5_9GAMM|nr:alpha/beta hydrolase [Photobacterium sanctipauli]PSW20289.1 alpha/beta hydrolase [Photobacterium sanctipauli]